MLFADGAIYKQIEVIEGEGYPEQIPSMTIENKLNGEIEIVEFLANGDEVHRGTYKLVKE